MVGSRRAWSSWSCLVALVGCGGAETSAPARDASLAEVSADIVAPDDVAHAHPDGHASVDAAIDPDVTVVPDVTAADDAPVGPTVRMTGTPRELPAGGVLTLSIATTNFVVDTPMPTGMAVEGHGHYHLFLDSLDDPNYSAGAALERPYPLPRNIAPGPHAVIVQLMYGDHTPYDPPATARVDFTVTP